MNGPANLINIRPVQDRIIVDIVDRGERTTRSGLIMIDDDFRDSGVRPREAYVLASSPKAREEGIFPGMTVVLEHGGWSRNHGITVQEESTGRMRRIWMSEPRFVLGIKD